MFKEIEIGLMAYQFLNGTLEISNQEYHTIINFFEEKEEYEICLKVKKEYEKN
jgi:hypothetical protein